MKTKFYRCRHCGNVAIKVVDSKVPMVCCGEKMEELVPSENDTGAEKHIPVAERLDSYRVKVTVGSVPHPMMPEHHISFIVLETADGFQVGYPKDSPEVIFYTEEPVTAVYEYCNIHGLWILK